MAYKDFIGDGESDFECEISLDEGNSTDDPEFTVSKKDLEAEGI